MVDVDWSHREEYVLRRHTVTVAELDEALADPAVIEIDPDYASRSGQSIRYIGWSDTAGAVLTVIMVRHEGSLYGSNGWTSNDKDQRRYWE